MIKPIIISLLFVFIISSCSSLQLPNNCGINTYIATNLQHYNRGPVNGGYDENGDGKVDHIEAFSSWDFSQLERVLHSGVEQQEYYWVNIDTCYSFKVTPLNFKEDQTQGFLYQTCRTFNYSVYSPDKELISTDNGKGCRNFIKKNWEVL